MTDTLDVPTLAVRHELPSGGWVVLRDHTQLRARTMKEVLRRVKIDDDNAMNTGLSITDSLMVALVTDWGFPYKPEPVVQPDGTVVERDWVLPSVDVTMTDDLRAPDYSALRDLVQPAQKVMFPGKPDAKDVEDPGSPTEPASA